MWLAELTECGLLRGSFIPPPQIAAIRELTRHRKKLIEQRASELQRLGKVAAGDLLPQHRSHDVLEIVVVDSSDRLETDGGGMSNICLNPVSGPLCAQGGRIVLEEHCLRERHVGDLLRVHALVGRVDQ